jgi:hypothetical protein
MNISINTCCNSQKSIKRMYFCILIKIIPTLLVTNWFAFYGLLLASLELPTKNTKIYLFHQFNY